MVFEAGVVLLLCGMVDLLTQFNQDILQIN